MSAQSRKQPDYGQDAPGLVRGFMLAGAAAATLAAGAAFLSRPRVAAVLGLAAVYPFGMAAFMVVWSRSVKVRRRERLLDYLPWRGDEAVLDIGCGRGLLLVAAARRTPRGRAVGVDIWRAEDQNDNRPDAALDNARLEGVDGRVSVETADMRALPYPDGTFDVVVSHWAVHNLPAATERAAALRETVRVLKPGGRVLLADIACQDEYLRLLAELGLEDVHEVETGLGSRLAWVISGSSFRPTAVIGRKPDARAE